MARISARIGAFWVLLCSPLLLLVLLNRPVGGQNPGPAAQAPPAARAPAEAQTAPAEQVASAVTKTESGTPSPEARAALEKALSAKWQANLAEWKAVDPQESADNSFCYVCHANYKKERLVTLHESEGVGCETCHGMSDKHSEDEDGLIPPDVLFPRDKVVTFCQNCHEKDELFESDEDHEKFFAGQLDAKKTCTSCHSMHHELKVRTRRWNKWTRTLEWSDGVRMMQTRETDQP